MTRLALSLTALLIAGLANQARAAQTLEPNQPAKVGAFFTHAYLPNGFDSNDHVTFVAEGMFRNSCYRPAPTDVQIDNAKKTINVGPVAYEYKGLCMQVILPFERTLDVGILPAGTWKVSETITGKPKDLGILNIRPSLSENADDYLYAPVSQAYFHQDGTTSLIELTGDFPNDCFSLDDVKVDVQKDVIVVQPLAKTDDSKTCSSKPSHFEKTVVVKNVSAGRYLLHVRSMNGNATNTLVTVQ